MTSLVRRALLFLLMAAPIVTIAVNAWQYRDIPRFGILHDDGVYMVCARSLAEGHGYRVTNLPGAPAQTKYPPLFPAFLALLWTAAPTLDGVLPLVSLFNALMLIALFGLTARLCLRYRFDPLLAVAVAAALVLNASILHLGLNVMSDVPFTVLILTWILLWPRADAEFTMKRMLLLGLLTGIAYLLRTAALPLIALAPVLLWRRHRHLIPYYLCTALPLYLAWTWWSRAHLVATTDIVFMGYLDYAGYQRYNVHLDNLHLVLWKNADTFLTTAGSLLIPPVFSSLFVKMITQAVGVAAIVGTVRLMRAEPAARPYGWFAAFTTVTLLLWHFPPNERTMLPIAPLLLAGLAVELRNLAQMIRTVWTRDRSQRPAAVLLAAAGAAFVLGGMYFQLWLSFTQLPALMHDARQRRADNALIYRWIDQHLPADARIVAYSDLTLHLATRRTSFHRTLPPVWWYLDDEASTKNAAEHVALFAKERGVPYVLSADYDYEREMDVDQRAKVHAAIAQDQRLEAIASFAHATLYRVR